MRASHFALLTSLCGVLLICALFTVRPLAAGSVAAPARPFISSASTPPPVASSNIASGLLSTRAPDVHIRQVTTAPDLVIESIAFNPPHPGVGEGVDITVTIKNQGDAIALGFYVYLYVDPVDLPPTITTTYTSRTRVPDLGPGMSFKWIRSNQIFNSDGFHPLYAWADRNNDIAESNEANNMTGPVNVPVGNVTAPDAYEDDDLCGQANTIPTDGTEQQHNLYPAPDKNWVKFEAIGGVTYRVQAIADGADADLVAELYSTCASPPSFGSGAGFEFTASAGRTYYVKIEHVLSTYGPDTAYRLRAIALNVCNAYYEPNNTCATAGDISVDQDAQTHSFCEEGDADWTAFSATAGSTYAISVTDIGPDADAQLGLYLACSGSPTFERKKRVEYAAQANGIVYIKTENISPTVHGPGTNYALQVVRTGGCQPDAYENDDTAPAAKPLAVGGAAQTHTICPAGETDWASFGARAGVTYTMETFNLGKAADTRLCLYNAAGTIQLACDDDGGAGKGSRIAWQAPANGTFALKVTDYSPAVAGPETQYDLRVFTGICLLDSLEPDNTQATARSIVADGSLQAHAICPAGDADWVSFTVKAGSYVIETTQLGSEADTFVELYDASGRQLAFNDDYGPGEASRIHYVFSSDGSYYVKVRHYDPARHGAGTEYSLRVAPGAPTPTPTPPTPPPTVTPTPPPPPSSVHTIILVNRARVVTLYGETAAAELMNKLDLLAAHSAAQGEVI